MKCPGIDTRYWKSKDIFEIPCPVCKTPIEFFKDDSSRKCSKCNQQVFNPEIQTDCLQYCQFADNCKELLERNK
jgi:hypothetical protein